MIGPDKKDGTFDQTLRMIQNKGLQEKVEITGGIPKENVGSHLSRGIFLKYNTLRKLWRLSLRGCGMRFVHRDNKRG